MALSENEFPIVVEKISQGEGTEDLSFEEIEQLLDYLVQLYFFFASREIPDEAGIETVRRVEAVLKEGKYDRDMVLADTDFVVPVIRKINDKFYDLSHHSQGRLSPDTELNRLSTKPFTGAFDYSRSSRMSVHYRDGTEARVSFGIYNLVSANPDNPVIRVLKVFEREVFGERFSGTGKNLTALTEEVAQLNDVDLIYSFLSPDLGKGTPLEDLVGDKIKRGYTVFDHNVAVKFLNGTTRESFEGSWLFEQDGLDSSNPS